MLLRGEIKRACIERLAGQEVDGEVTDGGIQRFFGHSLSVQL
jgi:hypothetical protein